MKANVLFALLGLLLETVGRSSKVESYLVSQEGLVFLFNFNVSLLFEKNSYGTLKSLSHGSMTLKAVKVLLFLFKLCIAHLSILRLVLHGLCTAPFNEGGIDCTM